MPSEHKPHSELAKLARDLIENPRKEPGYAHLDVQRIAEGYLSLEEQLEAAHEERDLLSGWFEETTEILAQEERRSAALEELQEQLEALHRGMQQLIIKNDRLGAALDATDRLLDDVYAKGDKHADDLLRVRTQVSSALADWSLIRQADPELNKSRVSDPAFDALQRQADANRRRADANHYLRENFEIALERIADGDFGLGTAATRFAREVLDEMAREASSPASEPEGA